MLTARGALDDRIAGLDGGADDYLVKPFAFAELLARLRALVRRGTVERPPVIEVGDLRLDPATRQVWRGEVEIDLSAKEFTLLETFMRHAGYVLSRTQLLEQAWEYDFEHRSNVVEVYVRYLRRKIDMPVRAQVDRDGARRRLPTAEGRGPLSRLSIRLRLTLVFAAVIAVVLAATGVFVYLQFEHELDAAIDAGLRSRADELSAAVRESGSRLGPRPPPGRQDRQLRRGARARRQRPRLLADDRRHRPARRRPARAGARANRSSLDRGPLPGTDGGVAPAGDPGRRAERRPRSSSSAPRPRPAKSRSPTCCSCC